jgi:HKD family nuclease
VVETRDSIVAEVELLIVPYTGRTRTLIQLLIDEFADAEWDSFQFAVAFASQSGNFPDLLNGIAAFAKRGGRIEMTFGADTFSGESGSEYEAIEQLLQRLDKFPKAKISLYREKGRTFHPKLYLFANLAKKKARLVIGSSNWGAGGFYGNVEANVIINLKLEDPSHRRFFDRISELFSDYWQESS